MTDFLLVHGSCHGAWCWRDTLPAVEALGHKARAIDLPSHGADPTPAADVTLDLYAQAIVDAIDDPVILVGHSMGGYPITRAAQLAPDKIARLVYLCAYVPRPGKSLSDMRKMAPRQPLIEAIDRAPDGITMSFNPAKAIEKLYLDVPAETANWAVSMLGPQPLRPQETAFDPGPALSHPRSYIICENDNAIPAEWQEVMASDFAPETVYRMPTSHSPFLSDPAGLAGLLDTIAKGS
ncbi:alpha/beta fold hydrolase [Ponticoccus sp. SC2-23]|uniref:alpha/beta fold hydrolase n=1 Tax=Alexandriicola marinus TaxID=2081710 RepID=UPI000FDB0CD6|nr:alpha/beta fold hydrolase [Alexandriicola marinus]MBM1222197.1 alpha/beta fold hydrolase [Ponticoccus sp. SC6-9]MBM1226884.1 alpha/beta fold hydrolase [Ponticoccus sp. SC6-15]MBM1231144.1 alpha/beta fold hydrolase [Ponticoccus sp. SC6-38]MBM1235604.1 alpha/beta fold hydrolase [Ponticoccus sp. SC6-45]MBM1240166.1 alpha/beta fold hydrolase [Ponticoccus sp. SC6-49]MBM1244520.1 alpha/beta fold hydrolase [Ponticoccus sp. SC2-64]MBM1249078.1 alpha/beta fold hydrolase [Ponticoccus sp. SC6-42]MB